MKKYCLLKVVNFVPLSFKNCDCHLSLIGIYVFFKIFHDAFVTPIGGRQARTMKIPPHPPLAAGPRGPLARRAKGGWGDLEFIF
jgi:hypothetical protein